MRCLVTGGLGFIGSHIAERLLKEGHFVRVFDNLSSGKEENLSFILGHQVTGSQGHKPKDFELMRGDILNFNSCKEACQDIDIVFHNAAICSAKEYFKEPLKTIEVNAKGTLNMLQAAVESGVHRFIFSSSAKIYGNSKIFPQAETHSPNIITTYALSKYTAENYCRYFNNCHGISVVSLRYFSVYGPKQSLDDNFIGIALENIMNGGKCRLNGQADFLRDFIYIDDVVKANFLAAQLRHVRFELFNVGTGAATSILELFNILNDICGTNEKPNLAPSLEGMVWRACSNTSKARNILNYPSEVDLKEGLSRTVKWYKSENGGIKCSVKDRLEEANI